MKKIDFPYNFPKKDIFLRKFTQKKNAFGEKKANIFFAPAALYRCAPPPRGAIEFLESRILGFCAYF